jgi:hypothetical protein
MSDEERNMPEDIGDELPVNPEEDSKQTVLPPGIYDAAISFARYEKLPDDDLYNPGLFRAKISYRIENAEDPMHNGVQVRGFGKNLAMVTNGGADKNFGWRAWLKTMHMDVAAPPKTTELQGLPVKLRIGTKPGKEGRVFQTVEELWLRQAGD